MTQHPDEVRTGLLVLGGSSGRVEHARAALFAAHGLRTYAHRLPAAEIPVDRMGADLVLVVGGDDEMWPSSSYAARLAARRRAAGRSVHVIEHAAAGHRVLFPGEEPDPPSPTYAYGGTAEANAALGAKALPTILEVLREPTGQARGRSRATA